MAGRDEVLQGLAASAAGYLPRATGHTCRQPQGIAEAVGIYCVRGGGWAEIDGRLLPVRAGDILLLPPGVPHAYGAQACDPWTIHWFHATGRHLDFFLDRLGVSLESPVIWVGENLQVLALFNELLECLEPGASDGVVHASQVLAHLFSVMIRHRGQRPSVVDDIRRVAQSIQHMNEHMDRPLRIGELAGLANLSAAHFTAVFRQVMGASPREYLLFLRMHRACLMLSETGLSIKEVADRVGYPDPFHFSRAFKSFTCLSPREYRERGGSPKAPHAPTLRSFPKSPNSTGDPEAGRDGPQDGGDALPSPCLIREDGTILH